MYEAARPDKATTARLAYTAAEYGYEGLIIRATPDTVEDVREVAADIPLDIGIGIELDPVDRQEASGAVNHYRSACDLLFVRGGSPTLNRFAVENARVDVLTAPMARNGDINHVIAKAAADHHVAIELRLAPVLRGRGGTRARAIRDRRKLMDILDATDAPYVVSADAHSHLQLRAPRALQALGEVIGLSETRIAAGLDRWGSLLKRARNRQSETYIEPGVRRGHPDHDNSVSNSL